MTGGWLAVLLFALQLSELRRGGVAVSNEPLANAPAKPTLVAMRHFPPQPRPRFRAFFRKPAHEDAVLIAVKGTPRSGVPIARDIARLWRRAVPDQRLFIAFAKRDLASAQAVQRTLERNGYRSVIYLPGRTKPAQLGRYYRESPQRLVLDSRAARAANGVRVELLAQGRKSCCKRCYYVNGMLAGCEAITCGEQCATARGR